MAPFNERFPATTVLIRVLNRVQSSSLLVLRHRVAAVARILKGDDRETSLEDLIRSTCMEYKRVRALQLFGAVEHQRVAFEDFNVEVRAYLNSSPWGTAARVAGVGLAVAGGVVVAPALAVGALNVIGFSAAGPVAGSIAAAIQSVFYGGSVGAGSLFALAQGAAMGGIAVGGAAEVAAGAAAVGAGIGLMGKRKPDDKRPGGSGTDLDDEAGSGDHDSNGDDENGGSGDEKASASSGVSRSARDKYRRCPEGAGPTTSPKGLY